MDYESYRNAYFVSPQPPQRFAYDSIRGTSLFFVDFAAAEAFYTAVLGPPSYVEGDGTRGWELGDSRLTLLSGGSGHPTNAEIQVIMATPAEAERLQGAFIREGATGPTPSDQLMYEPVRYCPVRDPFGTDWLIYALLEIA